MLIIRGSNVNNTRSSIKARLRKFICFEGRAILFFYRVFLFKICKFFRCTDNEDNNEITLRSITRRYPRIVFLSCTHRFFSQHFQYFVREFLSDASSNKVMRNKGTFDADALFACLRMMQKKLYHQKHSGECVRLQYTHSASFL